jgi:hypothetical protein
MKQRRETRIADLVKTKTAKEVSSLAFLERQHENCIGLVLDVDDNDQLPGLERKEFKVLMNDGKIVKLFVEEFERI